MLACNNGILALHSHSSTHLTRAALSPTHVSWLQPGALVIVANDRGQLQCFDMALSLVRIQLGGEDGLPVRLLDLADYFCHQPSLSSVSWAPAPLVISGGNSSSCDATPEDDKHSYLDLMEQYSSMLLLLHYSRGPLTCLRFNSPHFSLPYPIVNFRSEELNNSSNSIKIGEDNVHDISQTSYNTTISNSSNSSHSKTSVAVSNSSLTKLSSSPASIKRPEKYHFCSISPDVLIGEFLSHGQVEEATNLCGSLCWEQDGGVALKCVSCVVNYIIRRGSLTPQSVNAASVTGIGNSALSSVDGPVIAPSKSHGESSSSGDVTVNVREGKTTASDGGEAGLVPITNHAVGLWENRILGAAAVLSSGFLSPNTPLSSTTEELYGPAVRALARRLFFKLLRLVDSIINVL